MVSSVDLQGNNPWPRMCDCFGSAEYSLRDCWLVGLFSAGCKRGASARQQATAFYTEYEDKTDADREHAGMLLVLCAVNG